MIKAIFWDFDGVIADSVNVKTNAFYELYLPFGKDIAEKVKRYHLDNGGMSRFEKFKYFQSEFLGEPKPIPESTVNELASRFSELVMDNVIKAPYIKGVEDVLARYAQKVANFIITGTPTEEMKEIIKARGIDNYFVDILGSPKNKNDLTKELMTKKAFKPNEVIFIGDACSDYKAATNSGTYFILRRHADNQELFKDYNSFAINDFTNFDYVFNIINSI